MTEYTLTYFDARGWAEPARMILSYAGANWKDIRVPHTGIGAPLPEDVKARARFGQVPMLEFDGKRLVQSMAIARFLGKKFGLAGKDEFESAQCDEIVDALKDIVAIFMPPFREQDEEKRAKGLAEAADQAKTKFLIKFNEIIEENGSYFVGSSLTWADIVVAAQIYSMQQYTPKLVLSDLPALSGLMDRVFNTKGIKEWIAKRPVTKF